jgi:hypothetical protein
MGKIYGDAWRVVVWLGYHKLAITRIINVLTEIIDGYKECFDANLRPYTRVSRAVTRLATSQFLEQPWYVSFPSLCIFLGCSYRNPVFFFHNFLFLKVNNSRFARVWVVQECILARDLQFQLADGILPTKLLEIAFDTVRSLDMVGPRGSYPFDTRVLGH